MLRRPFVFASTVAILRDLLPQTTTTIAQLAPRNHVTRQTFMTLSRFRLRKRDADEDEEFEFDPTASITADVKVQREASVIDDVIRKYLPPNAPKASIDKAKAYLKEHPINEAIALHADQVVITHVVDSETGEVKAMKFPQSSLKEAMDMAIDNNKDLVQMAVRNKVSYCRIRNERAKFQEFLPEGLRDAPKPASDKPDNTATLAPDEIAVDDNTIVARPTEQREPKDHHLSDTTGDHYLNVAAKRITDDLAKGHVVHIRIQKFQDPSGAVAKLKQTAKVVYQVATTGETAISKAADKYAAKTQFRKMTKAERLEEARREQAELRGEKVDPPKQKEDEVTSSKRRRVTPHQSGGLHYSEREVSLTLVPFIVSADATNVPKTVRHPTEKEWTSAEAQLLKTIAASGRKIAGTYQPELKPVNIGARTFRVDKYGRRLD